MYIVRIVRLDDGQLLRKLLMSHKDAMELSRSLGYTYDTRVTVTMEPAEVPVATS